MLNTENKENSAKLFAVDSDILDRFQDRVVRIEFVRSVNPTRMCTILHLRQAQAASEGSDG